MPVGVAVIKQDAKTLNRLISEAGDARVFVTDSNGVVLLANHNDLRMKRLPGLPPLAEERANMIYRRVPETLASEQQRQTESACSLLITAFGGVCATPPCRRRSARRHRRGCARCS